MASGGNVFPTMKINVEYLSTILCAPSNSGAANPGRKESPILPSASTPRAVQVGKQAYGVSLISSIIDRTELSFFNLLHTDMGIKNCQKFFIEKSVAKVSKTRGTPANSDDSKLNASNRVITENEFIDFMRQLTDLGDHQIVEAFDLFDKDDTGTMIFEHWLLLLSLVCSIEGAQGRLFLYRHGEELFNVISDDPSSKTLTWEEFTRAGYLFGIKEQQIYNLLKENFKFDIFEEISFDNYVMYLYFIMSELDKRLASQIATTGPIEISNHEKDKGQERCIIS